MTFSEYPSVPVLGRELVDVIIGTNSGPTGVSPTLPGDSFVDIGSVLTRNVAHWLELSLAVSGSAAGALQFMLYDGLPGSPGSLIGGGIPIWVDGVRASVLHGRVRFVPPAGSRNYHVRWMNIGAAGVIYTVWGASFYNVNISIREVAV